MDPSLDFVATLEPDLSFHIFMTLDNPCDLARASCVSRSWHELVVSNGLCKQLCHRMFPQLSGVDHVTESCSFKSDAEASSSNTKEQDVLEREHRVYGLLSHCSRSFVGRQCISDAISASSTDRYWVEHILNTLERSKRSYWSSKGQENPAVSETLIYKLVADFCVITEIGIRPDQDHRWRQELHIFSAKSVRFRMGYLKASEDLGSVNPLFHDSPNDKFVWTYTSPEFPMAQEYFLQKFKFPEPVLCIGGFLLVELLGMVQREELDGLFYICIRNVRVLGRPLSPAFDVEIIEPSGKFILKVLTYTIESLPKMHGGDMRDVEDIWEEEDDSDEEFV